MIDFQQLQQQTTDILTELIAQSGIGTGQILVVGCSSSEIAGGTIGHDSNMDCAKTVFDVIYNICKQHRIFLAAQCCEHLNRALIVERICAEQYQLPIVCAVPKPKAGGSFATCAWESFEDPVTVETIRAHAGLDIGGTLIGMHLREVAVPLRLKQNHIGNAHILCARTRPKYIGGNRTCYE